jgi:hypothetical protein
VRISSPRLPDSPPESPAQESPPASEVKRTNHQNGYQPNGIIRAAIRQADADDITTRILSRQPSQKLAPTTTAVSAVGTPGGHTPPQPADYQSNISNTEASILENGISRFLTSNTTASSGTSASVAHLSNALHNMQTPPTPRHEDSSRSISPDPNDVVHRAKSAGNLASTASSTSNVPRAGTNARIEPASSRSPPSYTFEPPAHHRRPGGNTQAKLNLWRAQGDVGQSHGPPAPLLARGGVAHGQFGLNLLGIEERTGRVWDAASKEMGYIKRFRNPVLEGIGRAMAAKGKKVGSSIAVGRVRDVDGRRGRARDSDELAGSGGRKGVRFDVNGVEGTGKQDGLDDETEADAVDMLLRRMWEGGDVDVAGEA